MKVEEVLHMNGGAGENSYAANSWVAQTAIANAKFLVQEAILDVWHSSTPDCLAVADLGCSSGPSTLTVILEVIEAISSQQPCPELLFFLNDLPSNDFNSVFRSLSSFEEKVKKEYYGGEMAPPFYVMGAPGSFYTRLFPRRSIHFVHSSFSLMWLSQVPILENDVGVALNKWSIQISVEASTLVLSNYLKQFQKDFSTFLKLRSEEIVVGGKMVLTTLLRKNADASDGEYCLWELLANALRAMILEGVVEEEKLHTFNLPFYAPSMEELTDVVQNEGSFNLERACTFELSWKALVYNREGSICDITVAENLSKCIRSVAESLITCHFGEAVIDDLFTRYDENIMKHLLEEDTKFTYHVMTLKMRG